jgi:hypothetical protein
MSNKKRQGVLFCIGLTGILLISNCGSVSGPESLQTAENSPTGIAMIKMVADANSPFSSIADSAVAVITAPDMITLVRPLTVTDSSVEGIVTRIPAGKNRTIEINVYDSNKVLQYRGSGQTQVIADSVVKVTITVTRILGSITINGKIVDSDTTITLGKGLVAFYPFNGNAVDETDNGHNGTVFGATLTSDRLNNSNEAYSFDGSDSIIIPAADSLNFGNSDFSICFWIKAHFGNDYIVMGKSNGGIPLTLADNIPGPGWNIQVENTDWQGPGIRLDLWDGQKGFGGGDFGNSSIILSDLSAIDDHWHFIVFTVNRAATAQLYVDAVKKDEVSMIGIGSVSNNEPLRIGERVDWTSHFTGSLDQVRFYRRAINSAEIAALFGEAL